MTYYLLEEKTGDTYESGRTWKTELVWNLLGIYQTRDEAEAKLDDTVRTGWKGLTPNEEELVRSWFRITEFNNPE